MATLTKTGLERIRDIAPDHVEDVQRLLFDPLTAEQTSALADALAAIAANLCDHTHFQTDCTKTERNRGDLTKQDVAKLPQLGP